MKNILSTATFAIAVLAGHAAFAATEPANTPATSIAAAVVNPGQVEEKDSSEPATSSATGISDSVVKDVPKERSIGTFGAWEVVCVEGAEPDSCVARQKVELSEDNKGPKLLMFAERVDAKAPLMLTVGAPLGVSLRPGLSLMLNEGDSASVWKTEFDACIEQMCLGAAPLNMTIIEKAESPFIVMTLPERGAVGVQISLKELPEAISALVAEKEKFPATGENAKEAPAATEEDPAPSAADEAPAKSE